MQVRTHRVPGKRTFPLKIIYKRLKPPMFHNYILDAVPHTSLR